MTVFTQPTMSELAERERKLRAEILGGSEINLPRREKFVGEPDAGSSSPAPLSLDPQHTEILFINIINGRVHTTFGEFDLDPTERSQIAFVALNAVGRNLQSVINNLGTKYDIPKLQEQIAGATNSLVGEGAKYDAVRDEANRKVQEALSNLKASSTDPNVNDDDEYFDEEDAVPQPPKRQKSAAKR